MTIQQQYRFFLQQLQIIYSLNEATIITDWVFESMAGIKRFDVVKNPTQLLTDNLREELKGALIALLQHKSQVGNDTAAVAASVKQHGSLLGTPVGVKYAEWFTRVLMPK